MITGTAKLIIDLGNSETRVKTIFGKNAKGNIRSKLHMLDNRYAPIPDGQVQTVLANDAYDENNSAVFMCNGMAYCHGNLANIEFPQSTFRPSALEKKYNGFPTKLALINAFRIGIEDVGTLSNCGYDQVDVNWEVSVLLPPEDVDNGAKLMADMVRSIDGIEFLMPEMTKTITIEKVNIYPEGFCAFMGVIFKSKTEFRDEYRYLVEGQEDTLICDIGAGTTDFVLVHGSQVVSTSRFTREIGGNNVHRLVQRNLRNSQGLNLPDSVVQQGCQTGIVKSGARVIDITEEIADAKRTVSRQLVEAVQEFFESSMISVRTISNLLVVGGGAEHSTNEKISPIGDYIVEYMKTLSPDIKLVEIPKVEVDGEMQRVSTRQLNIIGAGILAE